MEVIITTLALLAYAGLHYHQWQAKKQIHKSVSDLLDKHDHERTQFLVEKMLHASKHAGVLSRMCNACRKVVHRYDLLEDGTVTCHDCKGK